MRYRTYLNLAFPDRSAERAEIRYSRCWRRRSKGPCSFARIVIRTLSWSRAADAPSLISNRIWPALVPSGARPMPKDLAHYRQLERRLWMARWRHEGQESAEEDAILDEMEDIWIDLIEEERALLRLEGPRCWPTEASSLPPELTGAYMPTPTSWAYEGFHSPAEAILSA